MSEVDYICAETFYENQEQLFPKPVAADIDEAYEFLKECMAEVFEDKTELAEFMKDEGVDVSGYDDVSDALEVFELPDGRYLYVEA